MFPPVIDLHEDISYYFVTGARGVTFGLADFDIDLGGRHMDIPKFKRTNVRLVVSSIAPLSMTLSRQRAEQLGQAYQTKGKSWGSRLRSPFMSAVEHVQMYYSLLERHQDSLKLVTSQQDFDQIEPQNKIGLLMAIEGAEPLEDIEDVEVFYRLGLRSIQLTWNFDNRSRG
ncbi:MAG: membrane dipeptidase, partial [Thaumarchaeota archaeon]|nr:membrane dipeptidase [Nitrososphaerota archaeon]